ncbi:hypothetical protein [Mucilaginibacter flavidus]|uniref:hypothetical protein n=1 Tax=Mucilaginibacter flavidus TaxID=2949309 RepID=UPI00209378F9|nr:hypothetical protein [Mucilaginibacter flavidus]MCO5949261.1 hypothetical protein [Mucilaginibacter flavidus]
MNLRRYKLVFFALIFYGFSGAWAQVSFTSSDKELERAFTWAREMALHYKGAETDPVGPWYEAALPSRYAFCMRDAAHQSIGAEILGLSRENRNMFTLFAKNISAEKNWCSYWEINKWGKPAPADYRNDKEFWYNLPANFDVLFATWRLYQWTGNKHYINDPAFMRFQQKTVGEYIDTWVLAADSLLKRPAHLHTPIPYNGKDDFQSCRGLPSYSEGIPDMKTGVDLVAALYRGLQTYADILASKGQYSEAKIYAAKAEQYRQALEADWWNNKEARYFAYYGSDGKFSNDNPGPFLLWFDALKDTARVRANLAQIAATNINVETTSYLPFLFYNNGDWGTARKYILYLSDPATARREYPEVSFGVIEGIVQGLMGITPDSQNGTISTLFKTTSGGSASVNNLPVLQTTVNITHINDHQSAITNLGRRSFKWKAIFTGNYKYAAVNNLLLATKRETDKQGKAVSWVQVVVKPGRHVKIGVKQ